MLQNWKFRKSSFVNPSWKKKSFSTPKEKVDTPFFRVVIYFAARSHFFLCEKAPSLDAWKTWWSRVILFMGHPERDVIVGRIRFRSRFSQSPFHSHLTLSPKDSSFRLVALVTLCLRNVSRLSYMADYVHVCVLMGRGSPQIFLSWKRSDRSCCGSSLPYCSVRSVVQRGSERDLSVFYFWLLGPVSAKLTDVRVRSTLV